MVWCLENYFFIPFPNQPGIYESTLFFSYSSFSTDQRFAKFPINGINYTVSQCTLKNPIFKAVVDFRSFWLVRSSTCLVILDYFHFTP